MAKKHTLVEVWESKSPDELLDILKGAGVYTPRLKSGLFGEWAAARLLAKRGCETETAGEILLSWLKEGLDKEYYSAHYPPVHSILVMVIESLGLMKYIPAKDYLKKLLKGKEDKIKDAYDPFCGTPYRNIPQLLESDTGFRETIKIALSRLNNQDVPEIDLDDEILFFFLGLPRSREAREFFEEEFFEKKIFRNLVQQLVQQYGRKTAIRYLEALKKVPDVRIPTGTITEKWYQQTPLYALMTYIGALYANQIEEFEKMAGEVYSIVKTARGSRGNVYIVVYLWDSVWNWTYNDGEYSSGTVNDGVRETIKDYLENKTGLTLIAIVNAIEKQKLNLQEFWKLSETTGSNCLKTITKILAYSYSQACPHQGTPAINWFWQRRAQETLAFYVITNFDSIDDFKAELERLAYFHRNPVRGSLGDFRYAEEMMAKKIFDQLPR